MLRITPSSSPAAAQDYYLNALVREDYYARDQELVGQWHGAAAELMGVAGLDVEFGQFAALTENRHPVTGERLTPRSRADRVCCWDLNELGRLSHRVRDTFAIREAIAEWLSLQLRLDDGDIISEVALVLGV